MSRSRSEDIMDEYTFAIKAYEEKLKELMSVAEFNEFVTNVAKGAFWQTIQDLPDSDFKKFAMENFEEITK